MSQRERISSASVPPTAPARVRRPTRSRFRWAQACSAAPSAPASLAASVSGFAVQLAWGVSAGQVSSYILEAGSAPGGTDMGNFDLGTTTSYFASSVPAGTYHVRVKARNACGVSGPSSEAVVTVGATCSGVPGVPGTPVASVSGSSVQLTWGLSSGAVSTYVLEVGSTPGATNLGVYEVGTGTDYRVSGVANGTYYVRIRARNPCGLSGPSSNAIVTVNVTPTGPPRLEIINSHRYIIETGPDAGELLIPARSSTAVVRHGLCGCTTEVFAPNGSRLRGTTSSILGRVQRNTNTGQVENWGLGAGETGCFGGDLGRADTIGRYQTGMRVEADPTTALAGQLRAGLTFPGTSVGTGLSGTGGVPGGHQRRIDSDSLEFGGVHGQGHRLVEWSPVASTASMAPPMARCLATVSPTCCGPAKRPTR